MKRFMSYMLVLALIATAVTIPTTASAALTSTFVSPMWFNGEVVTDTTEGIFGKAEGDVSQYVTRTAEGGNTKANYVIQDKNPNYSTDKTYCDEQYFIWDINFAPVEGVDSVIFTPNAGIDLASVSKTAANSYKYNRWNNVRIVFQPSTRVNGTAGNTSHYATTTMYLNGQVVTKDSNVSVLQNYTDREKMYRFTLSGVNTAGGVTDKNKIVIKSYVADSAISTSDTEPAAPVMPALTSGEGFTVSGNSITLSGAAVTASDLAACANGATVRVYAPGDQSMSTPAADNLQIMNGCTVVVEKDKLYSYYSVGEALEKLAYMDGAVLSNNLFINNPNTYTTESTAGYGGKADGDVSMKLTANEKADNVYFSYNYKIMTADTAPYLVYEYNVFPSDNFNNMSFKTDAHMDIIPGLYTEDAQNVESGYKVLKRNRWNRVNIVIENTIRTSGAVMNNGYLDENNTYVPGDEATGIHKAYIYVNGTLLNEGGTTCKYFGYKWSTEAGKINRNGATIRNCMYPVDKSKTCTGYFDDLAIYESDTMPVITDDSPSIAPGENYKVNDETSTLTVYDILPQTASDFAVKNSLSPVKLFADSTLSAEISAGTAASEGNVAAVTNGVRTRYYDVAVTSAKTIVKSAKNAERFNNANYVRTLIGGTKQITTGIGGKASDDESMFITSNTPGQQNGTSGSYYTFSYLDIDWAPYIKYSPSTNEFTFVESGYLVTDYNIYIPSDSPDPATYIQLFTDGNAALGQKVDISSDVWHRITVVHDVLTCKAKTYVDGKFITEIDSKLNTKRSNTSMYSQSRIYVGSSTTAGEKTKPIQFYVDDITTYMSAFEPVLTESPSLSSTDNYAISTDRFVTVKKGLTAGEIVSAGNTVRVMRNGVQLASDAAVSIGDVIGVENADGVITTYNIADGKTLFNSYTKSADASANKITIANSVVESTLMGASGKDDADESMVMKNTAGSNATPDYNIWFGLCQWTLAGRKDPESKYILMEANVLVNGDDVNNIGFSTGQGELINPTVSGSKLNKGQWNKLAVVQNIETYKVDTYLNGELITSGTTSKLIYGDNSSGKDRKSIRFVINVGDAARWQNARPVVDDVAVYETVAYPDIVKPIRLESGRTDNFTVEGNSVSALPAATVADFKAAYGSNVRIYTADSNAAKADGELLSSGDIAAFNSGNETYSYYEISMYEKNQIFVNAGGRYDESTGILAGSEVSFIAPADDGTVLTVAQYGKDDELQNVQLAYASDGMAQIDYVLTEDTAKYISAYLWNNLDDCKPLTEKIKINMPEYEEAIACWGDSLTYGQGADYNTETYPVYLSGLTGMKTYNLGVGGETATTIASRQGAYDIRLTSDVTIPASGEVQIEFAAYENGEYAGVVTPRDVTYGNWNPCVINGVEGNLSISVNGNVWPRILNWAKFTRSTAGEAVSCRAGDLVVPDARNIKTDINIFFTGTNGAWTPANLSDGEEPQALVDLINKQIKYSNNNGKYVVLGLTSGNADKWKSENAALAAAFGEHFVDLKSYLASAQALEDAGITPTDADNSAISIGSVPPSLLVSDGVHFKAKGYELIANQVYNKLKELGYVE